MDCVQQSWPRETLASQSKGQLSVHVRVSIYSYKAEHRKKVKALTHACPASRFDSEQQAICETLASAVLKLIKLSRQSPSIVRGVAEARYVRGPTNYRAGTREIVKAAPQVAHRLVCSPRSPWRATGYSRRGPLPAARSCSYRSPSLSSSSNPAEQRRHPSVRAAVAVLIEGSSSGGAR